MDRLPSPLPACHFEASGPTQVSPSSWIPFRTLTLEPLHGLLKESSGMIYFPELTDSLGRAFQPSPSLISPCVQPEHAISLVIGFNTLFSYEASKNGAIPNCLGASGAHPAHEFPDTLGFSFS